MYLKQLKFIQIHKRLNKRDVRTRGWFIGAMNISANLFSILQTIRPVHTSG